MTRLCSWCSAALAPANVAMALTPPSKPVFCCRPTVARETLSLPSPSGISFRPSMTESTISLSAYSQNAIPWVTLAMWFMISETTYTMLVGARVLDQDEGIELAHGFNKLSDLLFLDVRRDIDNAELVGAVFDDA
jgi:hypothetical protein